MISSFQLTRLSQTYPGAPEFTEIEEDLVEASVLVLVVRSISSHQSLSERPMTRRITQFNCELTKFIDDIESSIDCIWRHILANTS